jgi:hypothetical protein
MPPCNPPHPPRSSLQLANKHRLENVAFPAISTGVYGYPKEDAAEARPARRLPAPGERGRRGLDGQQGAHAQAPEPRPTRLCWLHRLLP